MKKLLLGLTLLSLVALVVFVSAYQQIYSLKINQGWNLVPFGMLSKISSSDTIQLSDIKYAWVYDLDDKKYVLLMQNGEYAQEAKTKYNFQRGEYHWLVFSTVWVYTEKSGSITMNYDGMDNAYYNLKQGWNFKMVTPNMKGQSPRNFVGTCNIEKYCVWERNNWECGTGEQLLSNSGTMADSDSDIFRGIIIKVSNDCSLGSSSGSSVNPPAIPGDNDIRCVDSDGGLNYAVKGTTGANGDYTDYCPTNDVPNTLVEYTCRSPSQTGVVSNYYVCPNGCSNGACLGGSADGNLTIRQDFGIYALNSVLGKEYIEREYRSFPLSTMIDGDAVKYGAEVGINAIVIKYNSNAASLFDQVLSKYSDSDWTKQKASNGVYDIYQKTNTLNRIGAWYSGNYVILIHSSEGFRGDAEDIARAYLAKYPLSN